MSGQVNRSFPGGQSGNRGGYMQEPVNAEVVPWEPASGRWSSFSQLINKCSLDSCVSGAVLGTGET